VQEESRKKPGNSTVPIPIADLGGKKKTRKKKGKYTTGAGASKKDKRLNSCIVIGASSAEPEGNQKGKKSEKRIKGRQGS